MSSIYYDSYASYGEELTANNLTASQNLKGSIDKVQNQIMVLNGNLTEWQGSSNESYVETVRLIVNDLDKISRQIDENLIPACEAADQLVEKLKEFKTADEEATAAKEAYEAYPEEPSKTIPCTHYTTKDGEQVKEHDTDPNPEHKNWEEAKQLYEEKMEILDGIKAECDELIEIINKLDESVQSFNNFITNAAEQYGTDLPQFKGFDEMTAEERKKFVDNLVENYKNMFDKIKDYYNEHYAKGIKLDEKDFGNMLVLFQSFGLYEQLFGSVGGLVLDVFNFSASPDTLGDIISFCEQNAFFDKLKDYSSGKSWMESGLGEILVADELTVVDNLYYNVDSFTGLDSEELQYIRELCGEGNEENRTKYLQQYFSQNYDRYKESYDNAKSSYCDYLNTITLMESVREKYLQAHRTQKLLPCWEKANDEEYAAFYEDYMNNPDKYSGLEKIKVYDGLAAYDKSFDYYMKPEEKSLYYYILQSGDKKLAQSYLDGLHNEVNIRYAQDVAKQFIYDNSNKPAVELFGSCLLDGGKDGVESFIHGIKAWFNGDKTDLGDHSMVEYVNQFKTAYLMGNLNGLSDEEKESIQSYIDNLSGTEQFLAKELYNTGNTVGYMAIPMTLALATSGIGWFSAGGAAMATEGMAGIQAANTIATFSSIAEWGSSALLGFSAGGNAKDNALSMGASVSEARGYGLATFLLETGTEAGTAEFFNIGGLMPGLRSSESALYDIVGEGVQEIFQTVCEDGMYNEFYGHGTFDEVLYDRKSDTDIALDSGQAFYEAIKAAGLVRGCCRCIISCKGSV